VLTKGTGYLTDVGMTGPIDSVIGSETSAVLERFLTGMPHRLPVAGGQVVMNSVLIDVDPETGKALSVERIDKAEN
jgi:calcineurin-like phosphoesterase